MAAVSYTARNVSANWDRNAVIENREANEAIEVGELVYLASDDTVGLADMDALDDFAKRVPWGICVSIAKSGVVAGIVGATEAQDGDRVSICTFGHVHGFSGLTPGQFLYGSNAAGAIENAAPANQFVIGRATHADTIFVSPGTFNAPS